MIRTDLSPVAKTLEALLLPSLLGLFPIDEHQHRYQKQHSTSTDLYSITTHIRRGFNRNKPGDSTLDLSKAFLYSWPQHNLRTLQARPSQKVHKVAS